TDRLVSRVVVCNEKQQLGKNDWRLSGAGRWGVCELDAVRCSLGGGDCDRNGFWRKLEVAISCGVQFDSSIRTQQNPLCIQANCDVGPNNDLIEVYCQMDDVTRQR